MKTKVYGRLDLCTCVRWQIEKNVHRLFIPVYAVDGCTHVHMYTGDTKSMARNEMNCVHGLRPVYTVRRLDYITSLRKP